MDSFLHAVSPAHFFSATGRLLRDFICSGILIDDGMSNPRMGSEVAVCDGWEDNQKRFVCYVLRPLLLFSLMGAQQRLLMWFDCTFSHFFLLFSAFFHLFPPFPHFFPPPPFLPFAQFSPLLFSPFFFFPFPFLFVCSSCGGRLWQELQCRRQDLQHFCGESRALVVGTFVCRFQTGMKKGECSEVA